MAEVSKSSLIASLTSLLSKFENRLEIWTANKRLLQDIVDSKEQNLGNPSVNGYILSSTTSGTRSWVAPAGGGGGSFTIDNDADNRILTGKGTVGSANAEANLTFPSYLNVINSSSTDATVKIINNGGSNDTGVLGLTFYAPNSAYPTIEFGKSTTRNGAFTWNDPGGEFAFQTFANSFPIALYGSALRVATLTGSGTRMVVADANGTLSTQTIPSGGGSALAINNNADNRILTANGGTTSVDAESNLTFSSNLNVTNSSLTDPTINVVNNVTNTNQYISGLTYFTPNATYPCLEFGKNSTRKVMFTWDDTLGEFALQTAGNLFPLHLQGSGVKINTLAGSGTRMVVADSNGLLSTQTIPSGGGSSLTIDNNADNRILTAKGVTDSINAEANLTFSDYLNVTNSSVTNPTVSIVNNITNTDSGVVGLRYYAPNAAYPTIEIGKSASRSIAFTWNDPGSEFAFQTSANAFPIALYGSAVKVATLAGTGVRMVVASADGTLSTQTIPSGGGSSLTINNNADNRVLTANGGNTSIDAEASFTFNSTTGKVGVSGLSGTGNRLLVASSTGTLDSSNMYWDTTNEYLGINAGVPTQALDVDGNVRIRDLSGTGTRMVVASSDGTFSTQAIPSGGGDFIPLAGTTNWSGNILASVDDIAIGTYFNSSSDDEGSYIRFNESGSNSFTHINSGSESEVAYLRLQGYDNGANYIDLGIGSYPSDFNLRMYQSGSTRTQILTNASNGYSVQFTSSNPGNTLAYWDVEVSGGGSSRSFLIDNDSIRFGGGVVTYNVSRITEINNNIHSLISREYADLTYSKLNGGADIEITDPDKGIVLTDSNLDKYRLTISTSGTLVITPL